MIINIFIFLSYTAISFYSYGATKIFELTEVAQHNIPESCWVVVDKNVYDLTKYLPEHKKHKIALDEFCGTDASSSWHNKGELARPHSKKSELILNRFKIGEMK